MCIIQVCFPGCDVLHFEINLIFLIKPFLSMIKKSRQKFKYLKNEKSLSGEIKSIFVIFKGLSVPKNCLRPESAPLSQTKVVVPNLKELRNCKQKILFGGCLENRNPKKSSGNVCYLAHFVIGSKEIKKHFYYETSLV